MTRKRFIKLLMSQGVQRNDAEKYAREEIKTVPNYEILYLCYPERFKEMFLKIWKERKRSVKRSCRDEMAVDVDRRVVIAFIDSLKFSRTDIIREISVYVIGCL